MKDRRKIELACDQVSAMLFFAMPPDRRRRPVKPAALRYDINNAIRGLVHLAEGLQRGAFDQTMCEACRKPILPGQRYVPDGHDGGSFHARCSCAPVEPEHCPRMPTRKEARAELTRRVEQARLYLKRRGFTV